MKKDKVLTEEEFNRRVKEIIDPDKATTNIVDQLLSLNEQQSKPGTIPANTISTTQHPKI